MRSFSFLKSFSQKKKEKGTGDHTQPFLKNNRTESSPWKNMAFPLCQLLGVGLLISGLFFFFAYNLNALKGMTKLLFLEGLLALSIGVAAFLCWQRKPSTLFSICATFLLGLLLAVFGQVYQSGAQSFQLFLLWAGLSLSWTLFSKSTAHWLLWLFLSSLFLFLFWEQEVLASQADSLLIFSILAIFNGAALVLVEYIFYKGKRKSYKEALPNSSQKAYSETWLRLPLFRIILSAVIIFFLLIPVLACIHFPQEQSLMVKIMALLSLGTGIGMYFFYKAKRFSFVPLSFLVLALCLILASLGFKGLSLILPEESFFFYFLNGLFILMIFTSATLLLFSQKSKKSLSSPSSSPSETSPSLFKDNSDKKHLIKEDESSSVPVSSVSKTSPHNSDLAKPDQTSILFFLFSGLGAFLGCILFLSALFQTPLLDLDSPITTSFWGGFFISLSLFLKRRSKNKPSQTNLSTHSFFLFQFSFSLILMGKSLLILSVLLFSDTALTSPMWMLSITLFFLTLLSIFFYRSPLETFLSWLAFFVMLGSALIWETHNIGLFFYFFLGITFLGFIFLLAQKKPLLNQEHSIQKSIFSSSSFFYAIAVSLCLWAISLTVETPIHLSSPGWTSLPLLAGLLFLFKRKKTFHTGRLTKQTLLLLALFFLILSFFLPTGLLLALSFILLGTELALAPLSLIGLFFLPLFLFLYYHSLTLSLLQKSLFLTVSGLLLIGFSLFLSLKRSPKKHRDIPKRLPPFKQTFFLLGGLACTLLIFNIGVYQKEQLIKTGERLLLPLAPLDPRSWIQGDYMAFSYELENSISQQNIKDLSKRGQKRGFLILRKDDQGVGHFVRFDTGLPLKEAENKFPYQLDNGYIKLRPTGYFFQEGLGAEYENAHYGLFAVSPKTGKRLLIGLADENRQQNIPAK